MAESLLHIQLVDALVAWTANNLLNGDRGSILADHPCYSRGQKPPRVGQFVPDIYVAETVRNGLIIGEAKTQRDLESQHTIEQMDEFLRVCQNSQNSYFVIAVPWYTSRHANALVRSRASRIHSENVTIIVIDKLAG